MKTGDFHIYPIPEFMRRGLLSKEQRLFEDIEKRINAPREITERCRILSEASGEQPASQMLAPRLVVR